jgi:hypothetical protein
VFPAHVFCSSVVVVQAVPASVVVVVQVKWLKYRA